ncbi:glucose-1-phosphate adenylyltransferase [Neorhodopirellula lusitana]|uniref:glucose-1-phosphate adenylyltransferase n=1 Tax=Neorhodopirellula lusitana TaxID=445327 RepID=UPI00384CD5FC
MFESNHTLAIVMAGGVGSRLAPLTRDRAKPAVPFGGQYRIIDFTLSNCLHSKLRQILVLTQYKSHSTQTHLRDAWSMFHSEMGEYIHAVPPQMRTGDSWYVGTADALYQNIDLIRRSNAQKVIVLSGDHVYRMDYRKILQQHDASLADLTVACMEVSLDDAKSFGVMDVDEELRVRDFCEKPSNPPSVPGNPDQALASMGIYVFSADVLIDVLTADHRDERSTHDFGNDLLPKLIRTHRVFGYRFGTDNGSNNFRYWRDVGTIDAYFEANMDLLSHAPPLDLHSDRWPIRKYERPAAPSRICMDAFGLAGEVTNSILSNGVIVCGGVVEHSILSPGVHVGSAAEVQHSVLLDGVKVGDGCVIRNCIIDKNVIVPDGETIGEDPFKDGARFTISSKGVVVVPKDYVFEQPSRSRNGERKEMHGLHPRSFQGKPRFLNSHASGQS